MMKSYEDLVKFNKDNLEAATTFTETLSKGMEEVYREAFGYAGKSVDTAIEASKAIASCKTPVEVATVQSKIFKDSVEAFIAQSRKVTEMTNTTLKSAMEPVSARSRELMNSFSLKTA
ncbi:phasin family protein [Pararhodospirillum oryzae]|uniref:Phasin n=1 Tax=Pararhodospirillum oryzae TaxID=478448 RepID=A0A512HAV9_9PROT|nr:phasin family protein [Pararhodospirillum oryzae]GEO82568.1 phasin [Pararhodospirillum oryzae]